MIANVSELVYFIKESLMKADREIADAGGYLIKSIEVIDNTINVEFDYGDKFKITIEENNDD